MKKLLVFLCVSVLLFGLSSTVGATIIFEDNFNSENGGAGVLNYTGFANWTVTDGAVDLIGNGYFDFQPGYGLYVDMDGSTGAAGIITTSGPLLAGDYVLSFDLAGNHRDDETEYVNMAVEIGIFSNSYSLGRTAPFMTFIENFTIITDGFYSLSFAGDGGDNIGMLLDNVKLETASVPEPATMILFGTGLIALAGLGRKKFL